eukprot:1359536-Amphidinium_carterae.1
MPSVPIAGGPQGNKRKLDVCNDIECRSPQMACRDWHTGFISCDKVRAADTRWQPSLRAPHGWQPMLRRSATVAAQHGRAVTFDLGKSFLFDFKGCPEKLTANAVSGPRCTTW